MISCGIDVISTPEGVKAVHQTTLKFWPLSYHLLYVYQWSFDPKTGNHLLQFAKDVVKPVSSFMPFDSLHCTAHVSGNRVPFYEDIYSIYIFFIFYFLNQLIS